MVTTSSVSRSIALLVLLFSLGAATATAQTATYEPTPGQAGKDVVWVPTPPELVEKMLDMAQGDAAGHRDRSGLRRRPQRDRRRQARRAGVRLRVQPRDGGALAPAGAGSRRRRSRDLHRRRHVRGRHLEGDRAGALPAAEQPRQAGAEVSGAAAGNANGQQHVSGDWLGCRRDRDRRRQSARAGARRT